jgi:hypothetical protein
MDKNLKYKLISKKNYSDISNYLDNAKFAISGFQEITDNDYYHGYDVIERRFAKIGILASNGDFSSKADFITDRMALDPSRRLFVFSNLCSPKVIKCALDVQIELRESFVIILIGVGYSIVIVSKDEILVYQHVKSAEVKNHIESYFL